MRIVYKRVPEAIIFSKYFYDYVFFVSIVISIVKIVRLQTYEINGETML